MSTHHEGENTYEKHDLKRTERDINQKALEEGTTPEKIQQRSSTNTAQPVRAPKGNEQLEDGYALNEGEAYQDPHQDELQQENYDPTHSGVRSAHNKPGTRSNSPGREGQTGWAEQMEMGETTDTPGERSNPAN